MERRVSILARKGATVKKAPKILTEEKLDLKIIRNVEITQGLGQILLSIQLLMHLLKRNRFQGDKYRVTESHQEKFSKANLMLKEECISIRTKTIKRGTMALSTCSMPLPLE